MGTALIHTWSGRTLSLKRSVEVVQVYCICYHLSSDIVPCSNSWLNKFEHFLFCFLCRRGAPLVRRSVCCQNLLKGGLGIMWLMIRLKHFWFCLDDEQLRSSLVEPFFPRLPL